MKNKRVLYSIIALLLILCVGIGYAQVTKTLNVNGASTTDSGIGAGDDPDGPTDPDDPTQPDDPSDPADPGSTPPGLEANFLVKFDESVKTVWKDTDYTSVDVDIIDDLTATIEITQLQELNKAVTVQLKIVNNSVDLKADIPVPTIVNNNSEYFSVETDWTATELAANGGAQTVSITIRLIKSPIEHQTAVFTVPFVAEAVQ